MTYDNIVLQMHALDTCEQSIRNGEAPRVAFATCRAAMTAIINDESRRDLKTWRKFNAIRSIVE